MPNYRTKTRPFPIATKGESYTAGDEIRAEMAEDVTRIDLGKAARRYKLAEAYAQVRNLEFRSAEKIKVQTFEDYRRDLGDILKKKPSITTRQRPKYPADEGYRNKNVPFLYPHGRMMVLVDADVYGNLKPSIDQYVLDVGRDGYWATIHVVHSAKPAEIRRYIKRRHPVGALLVGAIAAPWYEMTEPAGYETQFPCDLYYMDLNGKWLDIDNDGLFGQHVGTQCAPEIWIGRLYPPKMGGKDDKLLLDYFERNHQFRLGTLGHARSALAYPDDDWAYWNDCALDHMFPPSEITVHDAPAVTDSDLYKAEVNALRSWVHLCAHSSVHSHSFEVPGQNEYIDYQYFRDVNPPNAHFYNLFCCGPGMYTTSDYLAGWYLFDSAGGGTNHALTAIASAKSGSMLFFEDFYQPLGQGDVIGDAYLKWWQTQGPTHATWQQSWFYGLTLLGDPTLSWWKGTVPELQQPQPDDVFNHWPRKMQFMWDPVNVAGAKYTVEVDAYGANVGGKWAEEVNQSGMLYTNVSGNTVDHTFVGAQPGRWRVRAHIEGQTCSWSPWRYFTYTV